MSKYTQRSVDFLEIAVTREMSDRLSNLLHGANIHDFTCKGNIQLTKTELNLAVRSINHNTDIGQLLVNAKNYPSPAFTPDRFLFVTKS